MDISFYFTLSAMKETKLGAVVNNGRGGGVVRESFSKKIVIEAEMPYLLIAQAWEFPSDLPSHPHILSCESFQIWVLFTFCHCPSSGLQHFLWKLLSYF